MTTLYHELQICWEKGWSYERDWQPMSRDERARWIAYVSVSSYHMDLQREAAERERSLKAVR